MSDYKSEASKMHSGHRKRVRAKFIKKGNLKGLADHQILELLLFYGYSRRDTNEIAHKLLNKYETLYDLFHTPPNDLMNDAGLPESVAVLLNLIPHIGQRYIKSRRFVDTVVLDNPNKACEYMKKLTDGKTEECYIMINLNIKRKIMSISEYPIENGGVNIRAMIEHFYNRKALFTIIGHYIPKADEDTLNNELVNTMRFIDSFEKIGIIMLDSIIISDKGTYSCYQNKKFAFTYHPTLS